MITVKRPQPMSIHGAISSFRRVPARARWALAWMTVAAPALGADLVTARPHAFVLGPSLGSAIAPGVDPAHSRQATELPAVDAARVSWRRHIPGGVGCNVLVDADGRIFVAGLGRVTQLGPDGALQFSQGQRFSGAVAAALLADGTRAVLTREGSLFGWSPSGAIAFELALDVPAAPSTSSLLPLPDGGALASVGAWLFEIDATRSVGAHAVLAAAAQHTLLAGSRAIVIDEHGRVFEWDRREPMRSLGSFGSPIAAALVDAGSLVALSSRRSLLRMGSDGRVHELARLDATGVSPMLGRIAPGRWALMKHDGTWFSLERDVAPHALAMRPDPAGLSDIDLLVDATGVAWWASEAPLRLEKAPGVGRELSDVRCAVPASLVPAGAGRLVAACSSGLIWLVGPEPAPNAAR
jgi:hypothetical protein